MGQLPFSLTKNREKGLNFVLSMEISKISFRKSHGGKWVKLIFLAYIIFGLFINFIYPKLFLSLCYEKL